jgi:hypothetical protein
MGAVTCWPSRSGSHLVSTPDRLSAPASRGRPAARPAVRDNRDEWQRKALAAALLIAAGADLTKLTEWIAVGQERAERIR